jgi:catechol 2,3-dioxygenase-like lactoylglutathione lyase family enzyme
MRLFLILGLLVLWSVTSSWAQVLPPNDLGVSMSEVRLVVADVEANQKFWTLLGGTPIKVDGTEVMKFPGVFLFLTPGSPSSNNEGTVVNHFGFSVPNVKEYCGKWKAEGVTLAEDVRKAGVGGKDAKDLCFVATPDHQRIEINEEESQPMPIASYHIHFWVTKDQLPEIEAWYAKTFGSVKGKGIPGMRLLLRDAPAATQPTKGRVIDRIGFEVKNLQAFCKKLQASGVKLDEPYSKTRHQSFASAELTDPWGTSIALTEGLNRF